MQLLALELLAVLQAQEGPPAGKEPPVWCRQCIDPVTGYAEYKEISCDRSSCLTTTARSNCNAVSLCEDGEVCLASFDLQPGDHKTLEEYGFMNGTLTTMRIKAKFRCERSDNLKQLFPLFNEDVERVCRVNPEEWVHFNPNGTMEYKFACACADSSWDHQNACNAQPIFVEDLQTLARKYLMDPEAQNIGRDELMVMIVIALGCGFVFITLAFIIVAMVKRGRPSDDEFESSINQIKEDPQRDPDLINESSPLTVGSQEDAIGPQASATQEANRS